VKHIRVRGLSIDRQRVRAAGLLSIREDRSAKSDRGVAPLADRTLHDARLRGRLGIGFALSERIIRIPSRVHREIGVSGEGSECITVRRTRRLTYSRIGWTRTGVEVLITYADAEVWSPLDGVIPRPSTETCRLSSRDSASWTIRRKVRSPSQSREDLESESEYSDKYFDFASSVVVFTTLFTRCALSLRDLTFFLAKNSATRIPAKRRSNDSSRFFFLNECSVFLFNFFPALSGKCLTYAHMYACHIT